MTIEKLYTKTERKPTLYEYLDTCFADAEPGKDGNFEETFLDPECTQREFRRARRSFEDLLIISRTLYPKTSEKALARMIFKLAKNKGLYAYPCGSANRIVFKKSSDRTLWQHINNMDWKGGGQYSRRDIEALRPKISYVELGEPVPEELLNK